MRRLLVALAAVALALTTAACGSGGNSSSASGSSGGTQTVKVGVIPIVDVAPIYLGKQQGFFSKRGIDLQLTQVSGGAASIPGVISGDFQYSFSNIPSLEIAQTKGLPLKVVASGNASTGDPNSDFAGIVVPAGSSITSPRDLEGKTVAVNNLKNIGEVSVRAAVEKDGGDSDKVKYTELNFPDMPAAVANHQVDAAWLVEPFLTIVQQQGATLISHNLPATAPDLTVAAYFTTEQQLTKDPQLNKNFVAAMDESLKYAQAHPDAVRQILATYTSIKSDVAQKITLPAYPERVNRQSMQTVADLLLKYGMVDKKPDVGALLSEY